MIAAGLAIVLAILGPVIDQGLDPAVRVRTAEQVAPSPMFPSAPPGSRCPAAYPPAVFAGWSDTDWLILDPIIDRESHCQPWARHVNRNGSIDRGLAQINSSNLGYLAPFGITADDLFDGYENLRAARILFDLEGWRPWN